MDELQNWTVPARTLQGARRGFGLILNSVGQYEGYMKRFLRKRKRRIFWTDPFLVMFLDDQDSLLPQINSTAMHYKTTMKLTFFLMT